MTRIDITFDFKTRSFPKFFEKWRKEVVFGDESESPLYYSNRIKSELEKVGAVCINKGTSSYLDFALAEDATLFLLRWS